LLRTQNEHLQENIQKAGEEISKANEIIRKLQTDLKAAKAKLKLKSVVTLQQEKLLEERASSLDNIQREIQELKNMHSSAASELIEKKQLIDELQKTIEEQKKSITDNNQGRIG
jgi:spindle assembly abnormal protein 6